MTDEEPPVITPSIIQSVEAPHSLFELVALLPATADNVALQFRLCQRIQQFPPDELAFWLPQLVHVYVTVETESAALEDLLLEMCRRSPHFALSVFWFLQSSLSDLQPDPNSFGFAAAKRMVNKLQHMLFAVGELPVDNQMHENTEPALVMAGLIAGAVGMPRLTKHMKPLVETQGKKQRSSYLVRIVDKFKRNQDDKEQSPSKSTSADERPKQDPATERAQSEKEISNSLGRVGINQNNEGEIGLASLGLVQMGSQPNLTFAHSTRSTDSLSVVNAHKNRSMPILHHEQSEAPTNLLKTNYFRCETQLVYALISISNRLLQVPKEARQSALQVELALLNEDLPHAQVDLPMLLPQSRGGKQNRLVRICVNEATVLNSAEKAPFMLLIEYLRGDLTFDPHSARNRELLRSQRTVTHIFERPSLQVRRRTSVSTNKNGETSTSTQTSVTASNGNDVVWSGTSNDKGDEVKQADVPTNAMEEIDISEVGLLEREDMFRPESTQPTAANRGLPVSSLELDGATHVQETRQYAEGPSASDLATQLRAASVILSQLDGNTKLPRQEAQLIKSRVLDSMQQMKTKGGAGAAGIAGERRLENDLKLSGLAVGPESENDNGPQQDDEDPSAANLGEDWQTRRARIRRASKFGHLPNWELVSVIVKTGDDLRQEALASQLIQRASQLWKQNGVGVWVRRMMILITSANSGLVETITNALSLHSIKKALTTAEVNARTRDARTIAQLTQHFKLKFGPETSSRYNNAVRNFVESLAGYSVLCYLLQIKDRHNGNILVDAEGHIIHIDFGFMLSNSPGHIGFEANTFKLTQEYVDLMGGIDSPNYELFMKLSTDAFLALRKHTYEFCNFMEIMGKNSTLPCFKGGAQVVSQQLRLRLMPDISEQEAREQFGFLIKKSENNFYTRMYDQFQLITQGIYS